MATTTTPLLSHEPAAGLRASLRPNPASHDKPRKLTEQQLKLPFFRRALEVLESIPLTRDKLLPKLRHLHASGRRTRIEVYENLAAAAEAILVRYDLATGVLGWLDDDGNFQLNNQLGIANACGLPRATLNRLLRTLDRAKYTMRRIELIKRKVNGVQLIRTRVLIRFNELFWRHLGLSVAHGAARKAARKRRERAIAAIDQQRLAKFIQKEAKRKRREMSAPRNSEQQQPRTPEELKQRSALLVETRLANPDLDAAAVVAMVDAALGWKSG